MTNQTDPHLEQKMQELYDNPMQRKLRELCPLPVAVVVWQRVDDTLDDLRAQFRTIREHGFTALKQYVLQGDVPLQPEDVELAALEEGLVPWFYGQGGWQRITPELLAELDISPALSPQEVQQHPRMVAYQTEILKARARRPAPEPPVKMGEPDRHHLAIPEPLLDIFAAWLEESYGTLDHALEIYHMVQEREEFDSFRDLAELASVERLAGQTRGWGGFRQQRDIMRFIADYTCEQIAQVAEASQAWDPAAPIRTGSHHSLSNQAISGWDFELQARAVANAGSFYSSFHPTHHLTEVAGEMERPCYMTARVVADMARGGWPAMWESVGGPQTYSGYFPQTWDAHAMERVMLSYLAAGLKGIGIWCWNTRDKGWEIGEYSLCDLTGKPSGRARAAGAIAHACQRYRFELWEAHDRPQVGVLYSWENDAAFARLSMGGYPNERMGEFSHHPAWARIGAMRALMNHCVPFELVTERNLKEGLAARYPAILVPHTVCLEPEVLRLLQAYVAAGGRLVVDSPSLLVNAVDGTLFATGAGSAFETLFGLEIANLQSTFNYPLRFRDRELEGFYSDVHVTAAEVVERFHEGRPAVLAHAYGEGKTAFVAFAASSQCHRPGNETVERFLAELLLKGEPPAYSVDRPVLAYRRVAPAADHLFLVNDQPEAQDVRLTVRGQSYRAVEDCVTGESVALEARDTLHVPLAPWQARWLRAAR